METTLLKKKKKLKKDSVGNEENGCPVPYLNKINVTKKPSHNHTHKKKPSKRKSWKKTLRNSWRRY
jgi:hypothetical protein